MKVAPFLYQNTTLVWTLTTSGYKYYTMNLWKHLEQIKVPWRLMIVCADTPSFRFFQNQSIPAVLYEKAQRDSTGQLLLFGTKAFQEINAVKLDILHTFSQNEEIKNCIYMDGDIVVKGDFLPDILSRLETSPLLFQCDEQKTAPCERPCRNCCTGFIAWRHGADGGVFHLNDKAKWLAAPEDQRWVNQRLHETQTNYDTVPRDLYPNGVFSQEPPSDFYILHYNWLVGPAKMARMKKHKHWILPYM